MYLNVSAHTDKTGKIEFRQFDYRIQELARELQGRTRFDRNLLFFEMSGVNINLVRKKFPVCNMDDKILRRIHELDQLQAQEELTRKEKAQEKFDQFDFDFKTKPYDHQRKAFFLSCDKQAFGLFMEMGTGKTKVLIDTAAYLWQQAEIEQVLVLAPNGVHVQWINEQIPVHMPDWVNHRSAYYRSGMKKDEKHDMAEMQRHEGLRFLSMNIESMSHKSGVDFAKNFILKGTTLIIVDESSRIKNPTAKRTKAIISLGLQCKYRRIATGTPISKGAEDVYAQLRFLHEDILGMRSFVAFRARYCVMGGFENRQIVSYQNMDELKQKLEGWTYRVKKEDCLDLPDKIYTQRVVEFHPEQRKIYNRMRDDLLYEIQTGGIVAAPLAVTKMIRLQQILAGFMSWSEDDGEKRFYEEVPTTRFTAVEEILEECDGKVIIWARFRQDIARLMETLKKYHPVKYDGSCTTDDRKNAIESFREDPRCRVFIGQPHSAGIGLNLAVANTVIYFTNDFSLEARLQSEDRTHRIGQKSNVTYIDLITPGSIDKKIVAALRSKKGVADMMIDEVEEFLK